jgi:hypothetical protein
MSNSNKGLLLKKTLPIVLFFLLNTGCSMYHDTAKTSDGKTIVSGQTFLFPTMHLCSPESKKCKSLTVENK